MWPTEWSKIFQIVRTQEDVSENCAEWQFSWTGKVLSAGPSGTV